ncbi:class I SAM-dependent methyltransferase [Caulobacter sp.]|uniref:SAM-dependent methyltransferase n=1 Tax=Caulobacter sp. TaxID=78 RepID=UPI002B463463|nr:class I SAM-dependent methyltransferase [Caulobacter sp.]HJV43535.1 class I SAM-dependent methyltransferase [Caulobacter sp.]
MKSDFDETLWRLAQELIFTPARLAAAPGEAEQVLRLTGVAAGMRVLDLPCGPGRHAIALAQRGARVTGVDRCRTYIENARADAARLACDVDFRLGDMRAPPERARFDAVINLFTSFGYFEDPADDLAVLTAARAALRSGGVFLLDLTTHEQLGRVSWPEVKTYASADARYVERDYYNADRGWMEKSVEVETGGNRRYLTFGRRVYAAPQLCDLLRRTGYERLSLFGDLGGSPFDARAHRTVIRAYAAPAP